MYRVTAFAIGAYVAICTSPLGAQSVFYVSPNGNDLADGLTPQTAWRTLDKVSTTPFQPGQTILFERGGEWRGRLSASSSGTAEAPIVYGSYGTGAKPRFFGSDILDKSTFTPAGVGTQAVVTAAPVDVGSVLVNGEFLRSAQLITNSSNAATNRNYVLANPGTWFRDAATNQLFINTGTHAPSDPRQFTAVTRDDVVLALGRNHLVFRDIVVDESAFFNRGYGFRVQSADHVLIENSEVFRAGKHHFGVINSTGFHGRGLYAAIAMPDQGVGGATALVSYSDFRYTGHTSVWEDVLVEDMRGVYPAWYSHGEGIGQITLRNITAVDTSVHLTDVTFASGITTINGGIAVGTGSVLDGATLKGQNASLTLYSQATARNVLIDGYAYTAGFASPIVVAGADTRLELATVAVASLPGFGQMITLTGTSPSLELLGSILLSPGNAPLSWSNTSGVAIDSNYNLFHNIFFRGPANQNLTLAQWMALTGNDLLSVTGDPMFVDAANGNYNLLPNSPAIDRIPPELLAHVLVDRNGRLRWIGGGIDIGAFEGFTVVPEPALIAPLLASGLLLLRRARR